MKFQKLLLNLQNILKYLKKVTYRYESSFLKTDNLDYDYIKERLKNNPNIPKLALDEDFDFLSSIEAPGKYQNDNLNEHTVKTITFQIIQFYRRRFNS